MSIRAAQRFQKHEPGDDVTVACGWIGDCAFFLEPARHTVQHVVGKIAWRGAAFVCEVLLETAAHFQVALAVGIDAAVKPGQELAKGSRGERPFAFQAWPCPSRIASARRPTSATNAS